MLDYRTTNFRPHAPSCNDRERKAPHPRCRPGAGRNEWLTDWWPPEAPPVVGTGTTPHDRETQAVDPSTTDVDRTTRTVDGGTARVEQSSESGDRRTGSVEPSTTTVHGRTPAGNNPSAPRPAARPAQELRGGLDHAASVSPRCPRCRLFPALPGGAAIIVLAAVAALGVAPLAGCETDKHTMIGARGGVKPVCRECYELLTQYQRWYPSRYYAGHRFGGPYGDGYTRSSGGEYRTATDRIHQCQECQSEVSFYYENGIQKIKCTKCAPEGLACDRCAPLNEYRSLNHAWRERSASALVESEAI